MAKDVVIGDMLIDFSKMRLDKLSSGQTNRKGIKEAINLQ